MKIRCENCGNIFERSMSHYKEAIKFGWRQFCSTKCQSIAKGHTRVYSCSNLTCNKPFERTLSQAKLSKLLFCSHVCSAKYYAKITKKDRAHPCEMMGCSKTVTSANKDKRFCSSECLSKFQRMSKYTKQFVINIVQDFYHKHMRIPVKYELQYLYEPARKCFSTWNKAIEAAGFDTNPVLFAKHYVAKDGHKCDSLAEKIVDDWLFKRNILHRIHVPYPWNNGMKCDFLINNIWVELFGLEGQHNKYDELRRKKLKLVKKHNLKLLILSLKNVYNGEIDKIFENAKLLF